MPFQLYHTMTSLDIPIDMHIALLKDSPNEKGVLGYKCKLNPYTLNSPILKYIYNYLLHYDI